MKNFLIESPAFQRRNNASPKQTIYYMPHTQAKPLKLTWIHLPLLGTTSRDNPPHLIQSSSENSLGSVALSSCPGKTIDKSTPMIRRRIKRSLSKDISAIAQQSIKAIVCCLSSTELRFLGVNNNEYEEICNSHNVQIYSFPIMDGAAPLLTSIHPLLNFISKYIDRGENVLVHCRSGVGRASLVVACWLLFRGYSPAPQHVISLLRKIRHPHAVETRLQEDFIQQYFESLHLQ